jgi:peptidoglycan/LPS O-acetylase OafA/YrhL
MATTETAEDAAMGLRRRKTLRDYRLSLLLVAAGIAVVVAFLAFTLWANMTGFNATSPVAFRLSEFLGGVGGTLILVGAVFSGINR